MLNRDYSYVRKKVEKACELCNKVYLAIKNQRYCSNRCYKRCVSFVQSYPKTLNTGSVGAIGELRVSADLIIKGYDVFRALSPTCKCDLIILKGGKMSRVEVRTGRLFTNGKRYHQTANYRADFLASVFPDKIIYKPELT